MLIVPASKVSVPFTVVMRTVVKVPLKEIELDPIPSSAWFESAT
jgi:hypothetical protein